MWKILSTDSKKLMILDENAEFIWRLPDKLHSIFLFRFNCQSSVELI